MKLYATTSTKDLRSYTTFASSESNASKDRTRLKKNGHHDLDTAAHEVDTTRSGLIEFLNKQFSEPA